MPDDPLGDAIKAIDEAIKACQEMMGQVVIAECMRDPIPEANQDEP